MTCLMLWTYEGKHLPPKCLKQGIWSKYNMKSKNLCCVKMHPAIYRICHMYIMYRSGGFFEHHHRNRSGLKTLLEVVFSSRFPSDSCKAEHFVALGALRWRTFIKMAAWDRNLGTLVEKTTTKSTNEDGHLEGSFVDSKNLVSLVIQ